MTLIWAEGFTGDNALARLQRSYAVNKAQTLITDLSENELGAAVFAERKAKDAYESAVSAAESSFSSEAMRRNSRTHVLVIGVGKYTDTEIPPLTTSVRGAWSFAEWMLNRFHHPDRPLGSLEVLLSPTDDLGDWIPSPESAEKLGLRSGESLPVDAASAANIKDAAERWIQRGGVCLDNAVFLYFSGHGVWKSHPLLLPEDATLPKANESPDNLIDIQQTAINLFNRPPCVQCFFIDSCQEISLPILITLADKLGVPLLNPTNAKELSNRDAWLYLGSRIGRHAHGPENEAPYFTQELLACMERRGADVSSDDGNTWPVTTPSLRATLFAASHIKAEKEKKDIHFSTITIASTFSAELCYIKGLPEVFVKVWCVPPEAMVHGTLFVDSDGRRNIRSPARPDEWFTTVQRGKCLAGFESDSAARKSAKREFLAHPPVHPVRLESRPQDEVGPGHDKQ